jgi:hypothetical protein
LVYKEPTVEKTLFKAKRNNVKRIKGKLTVYIPVRPLIYTYTLRGGKKRAQARKSCSRNS